MIDTQSRNPKAVVRVEPMPAQVHKHLFLDPGLYPIRFHGNDEIDFVPMSLRSYRDSPFLDQRIQPGEPRVFRAKAADVAAQMPDPKAQPPLRYIFHTAFCRSTVLASAIGHLPGILALKEPVALLQLALGTVPMEQVPLIHTLLARCAPPAVQSVVVKASSACNILAHDLLAFDQRSRALCLYATLPRFLVAVLKNPSRITRMRTTMSEPEGSASGTASLGMWWPEGDDVPVPDLSDDVGFAAWVWLGRMRAHSRLRTIFGRDRIVALDGEWFASPSEAALNNVFQSLGLQTDADQIASLTASSLWRRHAKSPGADFDRSEEEQVQALVHNQNRGAIESATDWAKTTISGLSADERPAPDTLD